MLGRLITQGLQLAKQHKYPHALKSIDVYEANLKALNPTQIPAPLLFGRGNLVYNVNFSNSRNGTFMADVNLGAIIDSKFIDEPYLEDIAIPDYDKLSVEDALKALLVKFPTFFAEIVTLRKPVQRDVTIPGYFFTNKSG